MNVIVIVRVSSWYANFLWLLIFETSRAKTGYVHVHHITVRNWSSFSVVTIKTRRYNISSSSVYIIIVVWISSWYAFILGLLVSKSSGAETRYVSVHHITVRNGSSFSVATIKIRRYYISSATMYVIVITWISCRYTNFLGLLVSESSWAETGYVTFHQVTIWNGPSFILAVLRVLRKTSEELIARERRLEGSFTTHWGCLVVGPPELASVLREGEVVSLRAVAGELPPGAVGLGRRRGRVALAFIELLHIQESVRAGTLSRLAERRGAARRRGQPSIYKVLQRFGSTFAAGLVQLEPGRTEASPQDTLRLNHVTSSKWTLPRLVGHCRHAIFRLVGHQWGVRDVRGHIRGEYS